MSTRVEQAAEYLRTKGWEVEQDGHGGWRYRETPADWFGDDVSVGCIVTLAQTAGWGGETVSGND